MFWTSDQSVSFIIKNTFHNKGLSLHIQRGRVNCKDAPANILDYLQMSEHPKKLRAWNVKAEQYPVVITKKYFVL